MSVSGVLGFVELSREGAVAARQWFDRWYASTQVLGLKDPGITRFHADHVEALNVSGALDLAEHRTNELEDLAARTSRKSAAALAARCRGLLAAAVGDQTTAMRWLTEALALHVNCPVPFEQARTLLVLGVVQRRAKRKRDAAETLTRAAAEFVAVRASVWGRRAAAELQRVAPPPGPTFELTVTERRICELAASGLTNRQVAERAFISPKTVEANLARALPQAWHLFSSRAGLAHGYPGKQWRWPAAEANPSA